MAKSQFMGELASVKGWSGWNVFPLHQKDHSYCEETMNPFHPAFIQGIGGPELLIILVIILLLFGAKKLPELAKGLGKSMKEFKKAAQEVQDDFQEAMDAAEQDKKPDNKPAQSVEKVEVEKKDEDSSAS